MWRRSSWQLFMATDESGGGAGPGHVSRREAIAVAVLATALLIAVAISGVFTPAEVSVVSVDSGIAFEAERGIPVNTARVDELMLLPGIGAVRAAAIVAYREDRGPFGSIDSLTNVPGIGPVTVERLRTFATVGEP